jgi:hypothetical protein
MTMQEMGRTTNPYAQIAIYPKGVVETSLGQAQP